MLDALGPPCLTANVRRCSDAHNSDSCPRCAAPPCGILRLLLGPCAARWRRIGPRCYLVRSRLLPLSTPCLQDGGNSFQARTCARPADPSARNVGRARGLGCLGGGSSLPAGAWSYELSLAEPAGWSELEAAVSPSSKSGVSDGCLRLLTLNVSVEMKLLWKLSRIGTVLGLLNLAVTVLWVAIAFDNPWHQGPLLILNFPAGYIPIWLAGWLSGTSYNVTVDGLFLIIGPAWFFLIGLFASKLIQKIRGLPFHERMR